MDSNTSYEIKAEAFRIMTGHMAPGKDAASATYPASFEERSAAYGKWLHEHKFIIDAMLLAVERVVEGDE